MPRQCWIDQPLEADIPKLKKHLITDPIYDGRWLAQLDNPLEYLKAVRGQLGGNPGAYFCAQGADSLGSWPGPSTMSGPAWADWVYETFQKKIAPGTSGAFPCVHLNPENDDIQWQMAMLKRWRARAPRRMTVWSPVCHKAPLYVDVAAQIAQMNIVVAPQAYVANMDRVESSNEVLAWAAIGIPTRLIYPFLDGRTLGLWWGEIGGAVVFTQSRLP